MYVTGTVDVGDARRRSSTSQQSSTWLIAAMSAIEQPAARSGRTTCWSVAGQDVGRLGHEVHAAEDDVRRLRAGGGLAGQLERVAGDVGELDDLVALVVVAEHEDPVAERRLGRAGPASTRSGSEAAGRSPGHSTPRSLTGSRPRPSSSRSTEVVVMSGTSERPRSGGRDAAGRAPAGPVHRVTAPVREDPGVRVLVAPDKFAGTLTAVEAAAAIADGWRRRAPGDELVDSRRCPTAARGSSTSSTPPSAASCLAGRRSSDHSATQTPAAVLMVEDADRVRRGGPGLRPAPVRPPRARARRRRYGVGQLRRRRRRRRRAAGRRRARRHGDHRRRRRAAGRARGTVDRPRPAGRPALRWSSSTPSTWPACASALGVELVVASDVDNPLLGLRGAANVFGPQKGLAEDRAGTSTRSSSRLAA